MAAKSPRVLYLWTDQGRLHVTVRNATNDLREFMSCVDGVRVVERKVSVIRCIMPASSFPAVKERCQASGVPMQPLGSAVSTPPVPEAPREAPKKPRKPVRKMGRFYHVGGYWDFRFDK